MNDLSNYEVKILATLDEQGGFLTRRVAEKIEPMFGHNNRTHSGAVRSWLLDLKNKGLVAYLDNQKPVCWRRTPAGTAALQEAERIEHEYRKIHKAALSRSFIR